MQKVMPGNAARAKKTDKKPSFALALVVGLAVQPLPAQTWQPTPATPNSCSSFACSGDGRVIYTLVDDNGDLFNSTNGGTSWTSLLRNAGTAVSCSGDGTKVAVAGYPWVSTNSGASFTQESIYGTAFWSANGNMLVVLGNGAAISTNNGATWTTNLIQGSLAYGALSADGRVVVTASQEALYVSTNSGRSWSGGLAATNGRWSAVACTADGTRIVGGRVGGHNMLFVSQDSGKTWRSEVPRTLPNNFLAGDFFSLISSADGSLLVADISYDIYISRDFGVSWIPDTTPVYVSSQPVACTADGTLLISSSYGNVVTQNLPPPLNLIPSASQLALSWPAPSSQYTLQQASDLSNTNWLGITNAITVTNYRNQVILALPATGNAFYRLHGPTP